LRFSIRAPGPPGIEWDSVEPDDSSAATPGALPSSIKSAKKRYRIPHMSLDGRQQHHSRRKILRKCRTRENQATKQDDCRTLHNQPPGSILHRGHSSRDVAPERWAPAFDARTAHSF